MSAHEGHELYVDSREVVRYQVGMDNDVWWWDHEHQDILEQVAYCSSCDKEVGVILYNEELDGDYIKFYEEEEE